MLRPKTYRISNGALGLALGAALGTATAVYLSWRKRRSERTWSDDDLWVPEELGSIEAATVEALRDDDVAGYRAIDVAALGHGIIELTGVVNDENEAHRAVDIAQGIEGVDTVINRLTLGDVEKHLAFTRGRLRAGDERLQETHWYGMNVGTGRRRQSPETDPARRDDRNRAVSRALEPDAIAEFPDEADRMRASEPRARSRSRIRRDRTRE